MRSRSRPATRRKSWGSSEADESAERPSAPDQIRDRALRTRRGDRVQVHLAPGFHGTHGYSATPRADGGTLLVHEIDMRISGVARLSWPLVFRPLHDALMEGSLDLAEEACTPGFGRRASWSPYVKLLRRALGAADIGGQRGMGRKKAEHSTTWKHASIRQRTNSPSSS